MAIILREIGKVRNVTANVMKELFAKNEIKQAL